jgi:hypothetical protein
MDLDITPDQNAGINRVKPTLEDSDLSIFPADKACYYPAHSIRKQQNNM